MKAAHYGLAILGVLAVPHAAGAQYYGGPMMHDRWLWWMPFHGILWVVVIAAVIVGGVLLIRRLWHVGEPTGRERSSALDVLDARYARGEIEREDYLQRRRDLIGRES